MYLGWSALSVFYAANAAWPAAYPPACPNQGCVTAATAATAATDDMMADAHLLAGLFRAMYTVSCRVCGHGVPRWLPRRGVRCPRQVTVIE